MADSKYMIEFEQLLKQKSSKKPALYNKELTKSESKYKPKDVIESVYSQMKAIHLADCSKTVKRTGEDLIKAMKSDFLPINKLPVYHEMNQIPVSDQNKFETQCDLNTQILNILDGSDAISTNSGMTQEFDTTFSYIDHKNSETIKGDRCIEKRLKVFSTNLKKHEVILDPEKDKEIFRKINQRRVISDDVEAENDKIKRNIVHDLNIPKKQAGQSAEIEKTKAANTKDRSTKITNFSISKTASEDHSNISIQILPSTQDKRTGNELKEIDSNFEEINTKQRSPSAVMNLKPRNRIFKSPSSPLVVPQETFENFENMAIPIIVGNTEYETAKYLINSQILGTELCLNFNTEILSGIERKYSPILELKRDELKINSQDIKTSTKQIFDNVIALEDINITEKRSDILKDEILFSSDEENEYIHKELQDLPLTCALETSIDDQPDFLDKTMYVGFQTASNKSIQICTDSFDRAQSILEEKNESMKEFCLSEQVENFNVFRDKYKINTNSISITKHVTYDAGMNKAISDLIKTEEKLQEYDHEKESNESCRNPETKVLAKNLKYNNQNTIKNQSSVGFMTANFKKINMSDKAFEKCKRVFHDIDLDNGFTVTDSTMIDLKENIVICENENKKKASYVDDIDKMTVDDKINDELLLQEFENIEMSLKSKDNKNEPVNDIAFKGFKTANNKNISISKDAMSKTKILFQGIDEELNIPVNKITTIKPQKKKASDPFMSASIRSDNVVSFKTANHKNIDLSTQAIAKGSFQDIEIYNELNIIENINQPTTSKAVFIGFKTANNKDIKVSDEALCKTKQVFKDIDRDEPGTGVIENINLPSTSKAIFDAFKTANKKEIKTSNEAICKTKDIFKDINRQKTKTEVIDELNKPTSSDYVFAGFKIASGKNIEVSDADLGKSRHVFNILDKNELTHSKNEHKYPVFKGFKTASNKNVKVSKQAIERGKKIFQDIDVNYMPSEESVAPDCNKRLGFAGFKTANNKDRRTAEALVNSKKLFADVDSDNFEHTLASIDVNKDVNIVFKGFQTASKKPVSVSANALARSKRVFQGIDDFIENIPEKISTNANKLGCNGFQTANKKPVQVNEEAVLASQKQFSEFNDNLPENLGKKIVAFKTASNKKVNISDEALAISKRVFDDVEDSAPTPPKLDKDVYKGFEIANSKVVELSNDALRKAKHLLKENDNSTKKETIFRGFQTANKEKVTISKESIAKSKQLFHDMDTENDININNKDNFSAHSNNRDRIEVKSHPISVFGFQTGNNKKIEVSEDALMKTKNFFAEDTTFERDKKTTATETKKVDWKDIKLKNDNINIDGILNTQIMNNFEENLCTEDFKDTPRSNKRSGSPILPCPRPKKKKKFETPYRSNPKTVVDYNKDIDKVKESINIIKFKHNYKKTKAYTYKDLIKLETGKNKSIDPYIMNFNLENILDFEFTGPRNDLTEGKMSIYKIRQLFTEATDKNLIPEGWMDIQLKLVLWKLISYEIKFPESLGIVCTVQNVIDQLKYRYDRELFNTERPVLRKILEKDDVPTKTMVLCVAGVYVDGVSVSSVDNSSNIELLLTDGWYFVKATIDKMLSAIVYERKIVVGSKIMVSGAELMNCDQGVSPWEDTSSIRLSISGNSTFPVGTTARLGLRPAASPLRLAAVRPTGGVVRRLRVGLARRYPPLYVERLKDGSTVTRSERLEYQYQMKYEADREAMFEKIYEEVEKEFTEQESQDSEGSLDPSNKRKFYDSGSQIAKLMKTCKDPMEFRAQLTSTQVQLLQEHTSAQREKHLKAIQDKVHERMRPRDVVMLVRGRIVDLQLKGDKVVVTKGMLSVWKPNEEVLDIFKEGSWFEVMNVVPTGVRNSEIQLSAGRQSVFRRIKHREEEIFKPSWESLNRTCYKIKELSQRPSMTTEYNEIDTVGIIFSIDPPNREFESIKNQFQNLYLADIDKNIISVNFWGGIKKFGYETVLDIGQVIYCGNLQKRAGNSRKSVPQYRATEFSLFTKTPRFEKARELTDEINKKLFGLDRRKFCEDCLAIKQNYSVIKCFRDSEISPYRFHNSDYSLARNKIFIDTPVGVKVAKTKQDDLNLTGLDFESTFKQQDTQELSPNTLVRKKKINEKIARLKMYGEPPPLSPINLINKSKNAGSSYKSPLVSKADGVATPNKTSSVVSVNNSKTATPTKLRDESVKLDVSGQNIVSSPILATNRTYVVRSGVNPVKLNFSENVAIVENGDSTVDHFAEDFDGSPPLSLD